MPPEIAAVPCDQDAKDRVLEVIAARAEALGLPFVIDEIAFDAREDGRWLGGLTGFATQGWLFVQFLGVLPEAQGAGLGRRLKAEAEQLARERGLIGIWLDTFTFQAPDFYRRLGYEEMARIPDFPPGQARHIFAKRLDGRPVAEGGTAPA